MSIFDANAREAVPEVYILGSEHIGSGLSGPSSPHRKCIQNVQTCRRLEAMQEINNGDGGIVWTHGV